MENENALVVSTLYFNEQRFQELLSTIVQAAVAKALENHLPKPEPVPTFYCLKEVCAILRVSRQTAYLLMRKGKLQRTIIDGLSPRSPRFEKEHVLALLKESQLKYLNKNR